MTQQSTPRQMVKSLLQGDAPSRPLLLPIIFALGARLENLPLRNFRSNPTKIANALRQIRRVLPVDGLTCYFDPYLEAEALGCAIEWHVDGSWGITPPSFSTAADLRDKMKAPDSLADQGSVPVACEVIRRLKLMLKDEPVLMACVTGPLSLAAQLSSRSGEPGRNSFPPQDLIEFAAEVTAAVAKSLAETGADVILIMEDSMPELGSEAVGWYASLLTPINNMLRFYETLPALVPGKISETSLALLLERLGDNLHLCPMLTSEAIVDCLTAHSKQKCIGVALPAEVFCADLQPFGGISEGILSEPRLGLVTSATDTPATADVKGLTGGLNALRNHFHGAPGSGAKYLPHQ
jgi:hypothetical protein